MRFKDSAEFSIGFSEKNDSFSIRMSSTNRGKTSHQILPGEPNPPFMPFQPFSRQESTYGYSPSRRCAALCPCECDFLAPLQSPAFLLRDKNPKRSQPGLFNIAAPLLFMWSGALRCPVQTCGSDRCAQDSGFALLHYVSQHFDAGRWLDNFTIQPSLTMRAVPPGG